MLLAEVEASAEPAPPPKRGRGRPRGSKNKKTLAAEAAAASSSAAGASSDPPVKRPRGRPPKVRYRCIVQSRSPLRDRRIAPYRDARRMRHNRSRNRSVNAVDHPRTNLLLWLLRRRRVVKVREKRRRRQNHQRRREDDHQRTPALEELSSSPAITRTTCLADRFVLDDYTIGIERLPHDPPCPDDLLCP